MKKLICLLTIIFTFISCNNKTLENKSESEQKIQIQEKKKFEAIKYQNVAIILTEKIKIYDSEKNILKEVKDIFGEIVTIDSITKEKFDLINSNDRCFLHNFVKVKGNKISGWIYGQFAFEKENQKREKFFTLNSITFKIIPTKNFGIGVYDEEVDGLSFCESGIQNPVLFYNSLYNKYEFLPLNPTNENYSENYLTLDSHDGWTDEIKKYSLKDTTLTLEIYRQYQEGFANITVEIKLDEKQSTCKVLKVEKGDSSAE